MFFIYGQEKFLVREKLNQLRADLASENEASQLVEFDFSQGFDESELAGQLASGGGLFSSKKLFVLKNALALNKDFQAKLKDLVKKNNEKVNQLIFVEEDNNPLKGSLYSFLKKQAEVLNFKNLPAGELSKWINQRVRKISDGKVELENAVVNQLALSNKNDLWAISNEIEKLVNLKSVGKIGMPEFNQVCRVQTEGKIFDLVDALGANNKARALTIEKQLLAQGENEFYIFSMLFFQLRNLVKIGNLVKKGLANSNELSRRLKMNPFVVNKTLGQLRNFPLEKALRAYRLGAKLDYQVKQGDLKLKDELEYFLVVI